MALCFLTPFKRPVGLFGIAPQSVPLKLIRIELA